MMSQQELQQRIAEAVESACMDMEKEIRGLRRQLAAAKEDAADLDFLEREMQQEPLLLHNCHSGSDFPAHPRGLGLTPWSPRTLREAIRAARVEKVS